MYWWARRCLKTYKKVTVDRIKVRFGFCVEIVTFVLLKDSVCSGIDFEIEDLLTPQYWTFSLCASKRNISVAAITRDFS